MEQQKRRIGFKTSINEMQDDFDKVYKLLKEVGMKWDTLREAASSRVPELRKDLHDIYESSKGEHFVILQAALLNYWQLTETIALLGMEITSISKQVTNIEGDVKELKLRIK